jgi:hypothetical protein
MLSQQLPQLLIPPQVISDLFVCENYLLRLILFWLSIEFLFDLFLNAQHHIFDALHEKSFEKFSIR